MTCSSILSPIVPLAVALLGPAEATEPADSLSTVDPTAPFEAGEGEASADEAEPPEAAPPGPDPTFEPAEAPTEEAAPAAPLQPATAEPVEAPQPTPVVTATPPPARPIRWRLDLGLGGGSTVVGDLGFRAFSEGRSLPELAVSSVFDFRLAEGRVFLGGGLVYQRARSRGDVFGTQVDTDISLHEPEVVGRVSVMAVEGIDAFGRVAVGPSIAQLEAFSDEGGTQRSVLPRVDGHAGLSLYLPKKWLPRKQASRLTAGIQLGAGYTWRGNIEVQPTLDQGDDPLRATTSSWGELSMHGFSWRAALFLRVM